MTATATGMPEHGNAYNIFILVLTIMSLGIMVLLILPLNEPTLQVLRFYDNFICVIFLIDFAVQHDCRSNRSASTSSTDAAGSTCSARSRALGSCGSRRSSVSLA